MSKIIGKVLGVKSIVACGLNPRSSGVGKAFVTFSVTEADLNFNEEEFHKELEDAVNKVLSSSCSGPTAVDQLAKVIQTLRTQAVTDAEELTKLEKKVAELQAKIDQFDAAMQVMHDSATCRNTLQNRTPGSVLR